MMDYSRIGERFREIRTSQKLSLKDLASDKVTYGQIAKFERCEQMIATDKFFYLVNRLNLTPNEFFYEFGDFRFNDFEQLTDRMVMYFQNDDKEKIRELIDEFEKSEKESTVYHLLNLTMLRIVANELDDTIIVSEQEVQFLSDYLFGVETWTTYEITLFSNSITLLAPDLIGPLTLELLKNDKSYSKIPSRKALIRATTLNALTILIKNQKFLIAEVVRDYLKPLISKDVLIELAIFEFLDNLLQYQHHASRKYIARNDEILLGLHLLGHQTPLLDQLISKMRHQSGR
ncbi:MAG: Rgg/GadR/MutR family transcriptional regulator [Streptococcaceae bacterium]|nr:Rgg/GadR/MutR family transcriptional regulator [Streptococcaceae bacterium]